MYEFGEMTSLIEALLEKLSMGCPIDSVFSFRCPIDSVFSFLWPVICVPHVFHQCWG